jgi:leucyl aminopeptidase (aminopeptidase T)
MVLANQSLVSASPRRELTVLHGEEQLRALSNPERVRILELLIDRPGTAKQVADWMGDTRGRAHYHIKALEKAGLVEIISRSERGGVVEKFYRAVARNFCLAQGIGEHAGLTDAVRDLVSSQMLGWRRQRILDVDQDAIAERVIRDCLQTRPDDVVVIRGDLHQQEIINSLSKAIEARSAHGLVYYGPRDRGEFLLHWQERIRSVVVLEEYREDPGTIGATGTAGLTGAAAAAAVPAQPGLMRTTQLQRLVESTHGSPFAGLPGFPVEDPLSRELIRCGVRYLYLAYPTPERAATLGLDFRALHDAFWTALDIDYQELAEHCRRLKDAIEAAREVRVSTSDGSDLTFALEGREVYVDDGIISQWECDHGRGWGYLPAGKVIVAPAKGTANGTVYAPMAEYYGLRITDIQLEFKDGELISASAGGNGDLLRLILAQGSGDRHQLGMFEIGANPRIQSPIGFSVWDTECFGNVSLGIGDNSIIEGENRSDVSFGFRVVAPAVSLDSRLILDQNRFPA